MTVSPVYAQQGKRMDRCEKMKALPTPRKKINCFRNEAKRLRAELDEIRSEGASRAPARPNTRARKQRGGDRGRNAMNDGLGCNPELQYNRAHECYDKNWVRATPTKSHDSAFGEDTDEGLRRAREIDNDPGAIGRGKPAVSQEQMLRDYRRMHGSDALR